MRFPGKPLIRRRRTVVPLLPLPAHIGKWRFRWSHKSICTQSFYAVAARSPEIGLSHPLPWPNPRQPARCPLYGPNPAKGRIIACIVIRGTQ